MSNQTPNHCFWHCYEDQHAPELFHEKSLQHVGNAVLLVCSRRENGSGVCLDLQVIDNVPGSKVVEDMETHHVLTGNLYKPRKRVSILWKFYKCCKSQGDPGVPCRLINGQTKDPEVLRRESGDTCWNKLQLIFFSVLVVCVLFMLSINPTTADTSCLWVRRNARTGKCFRGTWGSEWRRTNPVDTNGTRRSVAWRRSERLTCLWSEASKFV